MSEQERQRAIRRKLAAMDVRPSAPPLPTGLAALDAALGGGWPRGSISELFGPSSSGKTTLALQSIAHLQRQGAAAAWIDADHTFDPTHAAGLAVDIERLPIAVPDSAEQAIEMVLRLAASGAVDLIVIDSAAALVPSLELETRFGDSTRGLQSRVLASGLRRLASVAAKSGATALFLNQTRSRMEASGGEPETSAGGPPLKLYAAARVLLWSGGGRRVRFRVLKNKVANAFAEGVLEWKPGLGFVGTP
jgi:recombination protein RecA